MQNKIPTITAFITARGGSKGLPRKNERLLCGKPLITYSIEAAQNCPHIQRCLVSTEDPKIKEISIKSKAEVIDRPSNLATDTATSTDVVKHMLEHLKNKGDFPEFFALLQPTSPLRNATHLTACIESFFKTNAHSCVSVTECEHHPNLSVSIKNNNIKPLNDSVNLQTPRQQLPKAYRLNGAIYLMPSELFLKHLSFMIEPTHPFIMSQKDSVDIDTEIDFLLAETLIRREL